MYSFLLKIVSFYYKIFFGARFYGMENIPQNGGFLICANHLSNNDPVIITSHIRRRLRFMAKKELFKIPVLAQLVKAFGAFPIDRGISDLGAVRAALSILKGGDGMMMFPEGRRNKEFKAEKIKPGALVIASKANVPILPVYIKGKYRLFGKTEVFYGKPAEIEDIKKVTQQAASDTANKNEIMSGYLYRLILDAEESGNIA